MDDFDLMEGLTPPQQAAASHLDGPLLILAGPGSGKTRVVTRRIANLLAHGVRARQILAITFTNKAAGEMQARVQALVPGNRIWISTFHRFCARILRQYGSAVGLSSNFSILDTGDQKQAVRRVLQDLDFDPVHFSPDKVLWRISNAKNDLITPEQYQERFENSIGDHWQAVVRRAYPAYQKWLLSSNSVDFDDLLLHTASLLAENPDLREELDQRFRYILVDEYQDTNMAQYQIVAAMSQQTRNLCVTGDPDQSIYGWRGARIENILRFERDFPDAKIVRLEENFRSTGSILRSADALIIHNTQRKHKDLTTRQEDGPPVQLLRFEDSHAEGEGIAVQLRQLVEDEGYHWSDAAIFYRVNSLSRQIELALSRQRIPFQVAAGVAFYDRTEIRDLLAYLRLIENPADQAAFLRIVNKPLRGLGKTSQDRLTAWAAPRGITLLEAAAQAQQVPKLSKKAVAAFKQFAAMMERFSLANSGSVGELLSQVIERTRYVAAWEGSENEESLEHLSNVEELLNAARQYDAAAGDEASLQGFLEQTALISDTDKIDDESGRVTLMTLHAAKGLEYPIVFILGVEDGLIPHERATRENDRREIEEERRLLFVGMTRAKQRLFLTESRMRSMHGRTMPSIASSFLRELECEWVDCGTAGGDTLAAWSFLPPSAVPSGDDEAAQEIPPATSHEAEGSLATGLSGEIVVPRMPRLMTGASLLSGQSEAVPLPTGFGIGQQVRHPRYGRGTVTNIGGYGARRTVTVNFLEEDRTETFVASKAPLQPVG
jgi:DNA helicase-2/ATP-dependent DNA helicase PcrA